VGNGKKIRWGMGSACEKGRRKGEELSARDGRKYGRGNSGKGG
jgi:hypothetical protein